ncbi:hypothetical protein J6590_091047 [Homalodisca vitripennis]|nr:hypothetical protein J6590_091047 [Homalodisca vitripennis]
MLGQVLPLPWGKGHSNQIVSQSVTLCNQTHLYHTICVSSPSQPHLILQCHTTLGQVLLLLWGKYTTATSDITVPHYAGPGVAATLGQGSQ